MSLNDDDEAIRYRSTIAIVLAILGIALSLAGYIYRPTRGSDGERPGTAPGLLARIDANKRLDAGYGVYPPYTQEDPTTHKVSGFSIDLIEAIAREMNVPVVWHRLNWTTMDVDLKRGDFDVIADPIFQTIPRAREFAFTQPYAYFADGIAVVPIGDTRFPDFASLDRLGINIAVGQGWASESLLRSRFSKATIKPIQTTTDLLQPFNELVARRADVVVADEADARRFVTEHPTTYRALWLEAPPAFLPAGFALRPDDLSGAAFLDAALRNLDSMGLLDALAAKYQVRIRPR